MTVSLRTVRSSRRNCRVSRRRCFRRVLRGASRGGARRARQAKQQQSDQYFGDASVYHLRQFFSTVRTSWMACLILSASMLTSIGA